MCTMTGARRSRRSIAKVRGTTTCALRIPEKPPHARHRFAGRSVQACDIIRRDHCPWWALEHTHTHPRQAYPRARAYRAPCAGGGAQDENGNVPAWTRRRLDAALQAYMPCHFCTKIEQSVAQGVNGVVCRFRFGKHTTKQGAQSVNRSSRSAAELVTNQIFVTPKARGRCRRLAAASSASRAKPPGCLQAIPSTRRPRRRII